MRRCLVVANRTLGGRELVEACRQRMSEGPCHFHVLVPMTAPEHYPEVGGGVQGGAAGGASLVAGAREAGRVETEPEARHQAEERLRRTLEQLRQAGAEADGELGDPDPMEAITHALVRDRYDETIISTLPLGVSRWVKLDLPSRVERRFGLPVTHVVAGS